ncbi:MAG TPA: type II secretion system protein GspL [bacterium]
MTRQIVVERTRRSIRVALASRRGRRWRVEAARSAPVADGDDEAQLLRRLIAPLKPAGARVVAVLPREQVLVRTVSFPSEEARELAQMVELYARANLPYPREQVVVGFSVLGRHGGFARVAVVAAQHDAIERELAWLNQAGLPSASVAVSSWGVWGWYRLRAESAEPTLVIHIDETRTDFTVIAERRLMSSRGLAQGASDWASQADARELVALEAERSVATARKDLPDLELRAAVLAGVGIPPAWADAVSRRLGVPVTVMEAGRTGGDGASIVAEGLAVSGPEEIPNLAPPERRARARHEAQARELGLAGALLVTAFALAFAVLQARVSRLERAAGGLQRALDEITPRAEDAKTRKHALETVAGLLRGRRRLAVVLGGILGATPEAVRLEAVTVEGERGETTVRGHASSTQTVLAYVESITALEGIGGVQLRYTRNRTLPGGAARTDFELVAKEGADR